MLNNEQINGAFLQDACPQRTYALVSSTANSSLYSDGEAALDQPRTLLVSHEMSKDKSVRNTAIIFKDIVLDAEDGVTTGRNQVMVKVTTDVNVVSKADIIKLILRACGTCVTHADSVSTAVVDGVTMSSSLDLDRVVNGEH